MLSIKTKRDYLLNLIEKLWNKIVAKHQYILIVSQIALIQLKLKTKKII